MRMSARVAPPSVTSLGPELHPDPVTGQVDAGHLADLDAGDAHLVVRAQAGRLAEVGLVGGAAE
jgi:hypothetical protein